MPRRTAASPLLRLLLSSALFSVGFGQLVLACETTDLAGQGQDSVDAAGTYLDAAPAIDSASALEDGSPEEGGVPEAGIDATLDAGGDGASDAVADAPAEALTDAPSDAPADASADATGDATDAAAPPEERVSIAACPWAVTVVGDKAFWTETTSSGCSVPAVRSCSTTTPCASLPGALYTGVSGQSLPFGIAAVAAAGPVFYSDNQVPNNTVWRLELDGGRSSIIPTFLPGAGLATDGNNLYWGSGGGLFKIPIGAGGGGTIWNTDMAGTIDNGPNTVTFDGARVFGATAGSTIRSCTVGGTCDTLTSSLVGSTPSDAGTEAQIGGLASDGTHVYFTSGMPYYTTTGKERLWRCPIGGCPGGPELLHERTTTVAGIKGSHFGVAVDGNRVYFGTVQGTVESCPKTGGTCSPTVLVANARPFGFTIAGPYLYWADWRGGIYRITRP